MFTSHFPTARSVAQMHTARTNQLKYSTATRLDIRNSVQICYPHSSCLLPFPAKQFHDNFLKKIEMSANRTREEIATSKKARNIPSEIKFEGIDVLVKSESAHSPQNVIAINSFTLFTLTFVGSLRSDKRDKFRHTLLHGILTVFGNLGVSRQGLLHDTSDVCGR